MTDGKGKRSPQRSQVMKRTVAISFLAGIPLLLAALVMADVMNIHVGTLKTIPPSVASQQPFSEAGKIHIGDLKIIPGLTAGSVYDDNIFLGNGRNDAGEKEESDWIMHVMPRLLLDYGFGPRGRFRLGYRSDLAYYEDNNKNDWQTHEGLFDLDYRSPGGLLLRVLNTYTDAEDPYSSANEYELGRKIKRWHNDLRTEAGFDFGNRFRILGYYDYYKQDYDHAEDFTQDYDYNELGAGFQMRLLQKTWGFVRYHYGERDYFSHREGITEANDADFSWNRINAGLAWEPGAKLSGELNFGFQWKDYDNRTNKDGYIYDNRNTWIASTLISYQPALTRVLSLSLIRAVREVGAGTDEYFEDTGAGLSLQQAFLDKFVLTVGGTYSQNDYNVFDDRPRKDDNYKASIGLDYQIQGWLSAGVSYSLWKKDSNITKYDFTDNRFMATLDVVY
jgi:hypothetical protein